MRFLHHLRNATLELAVTVAIVAPLGLPGLALWLLPWAQPWFPLICGVWAFAYLIVFLAVFDWWVSREEEAE